MADYPFRNLVFHGGGMRAFAYHGALAVLDEHGILHQIERVAGTSAGAMTAALVSFRLCAKETVALFRSIDYSKIPEMNDSVDSPPGRGGGPGFLPWSSRRTERDFTTPQPIGASLERIAVGLNALNRIVRKYGMHCTCYPYAWMTETIASQCRGDGRATFADFRRFGFRDLSVVTTNISTHKAVIFSADTTPDVAVVDALLMSQSIPLFFEAPRFDGKRLGSGDYYGDGGMLNNYPIHLFDEPKYAVNNSWYIGGVNWETIGCHLYTPDDATSISKRRPISSVASYVTNLIEILIKAEAARYECDPTARQRTIDISNCGISVIDFSIKLTPDDPRYVQLVEAGERGARAFLASYQPPKPN